MSGLCRLAAGRARGSTRHAMRLKLLLDMNLSPRWVPVLQQHGWQAVHWASIGDSRATDREIMDWTAAHKFVVFTHDLGFGTMLALSH